MADRPRVAMVGNDDALLRRVEERLAVDFDLQRATPEAVTGEPFVAVLFDVGRGDLQQLTRLARWIEGSAPPCVIALSRWSDEGLRRKARELGAFELVRVGANLIEDLVECMAVLRGVEGWEPPPGRTWRLGDLIGAAPAMLEVYEQIRRTARLSPREPVLVVGETGTGKECVAREVHRLAGGPQDRYVAVNCAEREALQDDYLFGHVRGAFTGAVTDSEGAFARAGDGTLLLDEIGDSTPQFQVKLLRVLEQRTFLPIGAKKQFAVRCRVLVATFRDLENEVAFNRFRRDLYYRIQGTIIRLPPLRERGDDRQLLFHSLLSRLCRDARRPYVAPDPARLRSTLEGHDWPGNVRELRNYALRCLNSTPEGSTNLTLPPIDHSEVRHRSRDSLGSTDLPSWQSYVDRIEREYLIRALDLAGGNQSRAAALAGLHRTQFRRRLKAHGLLGRDDLEPLDGE